MLRKILTIFMLCSICCNVTAGWFVVTKHGIVLAVNAGLWYKQSQYHRNEIAQKHKQDLIKNVTTEGVQHGSQALLQYSWIPSCLHGTIQNNLADRVSSTLNTDQQNTSPSSQEKAPSGTQISHLIPTGVFVGGITALTYRKRAKFIESLLYNCLKESQSKKLSGLQLSKADATALYTTGCNGINAWVDDEQFDKISNYFKNKFQNTILNQLHSHKDLCALYIARGINNAGIPYNLPIKIPRQQEEGKDCIQLTKKTSLDLQLIEDAVQAAVRNDTQQIHNISDNIIKYFHRDGLSHTETSDNNVCALICIPRDE